MTNYNILIDDAIDTLCDKAQQLGYDITPQDITFDDSRGWSLFIYGATINYPSYKFGAYRNYLGGGVRGALEHNGTDDTQQLGQLFADTLSEIEDIINSGYEDAESWELPTGVLL